MKESFEVWVRVFHCVKELGKAVDSVRKKEHRKLKAEQAGESILNKTKYLWLKNPKNWNDSQRERFEELKIDALQVGRAWSISQAFQELWEYHYAGSALKFFNRWYFWATHSRLKPIIEAAKTLKRHLPGVTHVLQASDYQRGCRGDEFQDPTH